MNNVYQFIHLNALSHFFLDDCTFLQCRFRWAQPWELCITVRIFGSVVIRFDLSATAAAAAAAPVITFAAVVAIVVVLQLTGGCVLPLIFITF